MSVIREVTRRQCDLCGAISEVTDSSGTPPGWMYAPFELLYAGIYVRDFCTDCLGHQFIQVIGLFLAKYEAVKERNDADLG
jgi:hypothetical protein